MAWSGMKVGVPIMGVQCHDAETWGHEPALASKIIAMLRRRCAQVIIHGRPIPFHHIDKQP